MMALDGSFPGVAGFEQSIHEGWMRQAASDGNSEFGFPGEAGLGQSIHSDVDATLRSGCFFGGLRSVLLVKPPFGKSCLF